MFRYILVIKDMKPIKVEIEQLGAIRDSEFMITPVMFFLGESGLGKSYLAILSHYFFDVLVNRERLSRFFEERPNSKFSELRQNHFSKRDRGIALSFSTKEFSDWLTNDLIAYMKHMLNHDSLSPSLTITLPFTSDDFEITYTSEIEGLKDKEEIVYILELGDLSYRVSGMDVIGNESPFSILMRHFLMDQIFGNYMALEDCVVLPPSRGAYFTEELRGKSGLFQKFIWKMAKLRLTPEFPSEQPKDLVELFERIIRGKIIPKEDGYYYLNHGEELPLSAAASSVRELSPLSLIINRLDVAKTALLFEEPEAHLHPAMQRTMADLLALLISEGMYMQITTHSDHLIRRFNELIDLGILNKRLNSEKEYKTFLRENKIEEVCFIDQSHHKNISVYLLERRKDGTSRISRKELTNGISLGSFTETVKESLRTGTILQEKLDESDE